MENDYSSKTFLFSGNLLFAEEVYQRYLADPNSVDQSWIQYFQAMGENANIKMDGPSWFTRNPSIIGYVSKEEKAQQAKKAGNLDVNAVRHALAAAHIIDAYRDYGHIEVPYDPLGLQHPEHFDILHLPYYGITDEEASSAVHLNNEFGLQSATFNELLQILRSIYSSRIGFEFTHLENEAERLWLQHEIEATAGNFTMSEDVRKRALNTVMEAEKFEDFLHVKFPGTKRFSIEGGEASIAALELMIETSAKNDVNSVVIGMAHRGRLNTLTKIMGKPYQAMLSELKGELAFPRELGIPGDVKYHLGYSSDREIAGKKVHLSLTPNPSHLEVVNSVVLGKVRALQDMASDTERKNVLSILIHGDAAFAGQGSVAESLSLSCLTAYKVGGALHIVINNQVGFTTNFQDARSSRYATDIAKAISAPVFHVNGDDVDAVLFAADLAARYRAIFKKDVVLDVVCYRKYGHNEGDEPFFTQPVMYKTISSHPNPEEVYSAKLLGENVVTESEYNDIKAKFKEKLDQELKAAEVYKAKADWLTGNWSKMERSLMKNVISETGVKRSILKEVGLKLSQYPADFKINPKLAKLMQQRKEMAESGKDLDWGMGEALAFATLVHEGFNVRISGQDCKRGTFSHRHAVLFDQETENEYMAINSMSADQKGKLEVYNSNLSEFAVMAFEYGYSMTAPNTLTIWEGQFGDFANGAQVVIDQYIASGEMKWLRMNGLVLLLPHGYEGNGPEHSSARPERFLQLCADDNMQVVNCSTPASFFHVLRRQLHRKFRKPLIVMTPKSLLRHKLATSTFEEMSEKSSFLPVIDDNTPELVKKPKVRKVILCTGKVYYDLYEDRAARKAYDVALIRLEQIYPFPHDELLNILKLYEGAEIVWCQEEHKNMGYYFFVEPMIEGVLIKIKTRSQRASYVGRPESASPAVGYMKLHIVELKRFLEEAFA